MDREVERQGKRRQKGGWAKRESPPFSIFFSPSNREKEDDEVKDGGNSYLFYI